MYSVSVIPSDLRHEETIIQTASALEYLHNVINDIFNKIDFRIDKNNSKISELKIRINAANNKIDCLAGINKAVKVFSPAKFPAPQIFQASIPTTFNRIETNLQETTKVKSGYQIKSNYDLVYHRSIKDKLLFFHVRSNMKEKSRLHWLLDQKEGLGYIPRNFTFVNSVLLYNSSRNVYEDYKSLDVSRKENKAKHIISDTSTIKIDAAPLSISTHRQAGEKRHDQGLFYTPKLSEAPEINVPIDLPDLPGIADDISFEITENEKIAPSLYMENLPELPEPSDIKKEFTENLVSECEADFNKVSGIIEKQAIPPPPPPPPPIPTSEPKNIEHNLADAVSATPNTEARSNLMEAIRKAGGARGGKLRAAANVTKSETNSSFKNKKPVGDLMADLHNKLSMRRKGISGTKDSTDVKSQNSGNVIDRLSALIPPPPPLNSSTTDASDEDDWAD